MIETLLVIPADGSLQIHLICASWLREVEKARLNARVERACEILSTQVPCSIAVHERGALQGCHAPWPAVFLFASLQAGKIDPELVETLIQGRLHEQDLIDLANHPQPPMTRLALLRKLGQELPTPARMILAALDSRQRARDLAHPSVAVSLYSGESTRRSIELLQLSSRLSQRFSESKAIAASLDILGVPLHGPAIPLSKSEALYDFGREDTDTESHQIEESLALARGLSVDLLRALRRSRSRHDPNLRAWLRAEIGDVGLPPALFPIFAQKLGREGWRIGPINRGFQVTHPSGAVILRANTKVLARARAIALASAIFGSSVEPTSGGRAWERVAEFLAGRTERGARLAIIGPSYTEGEDPLNAGEHHSLALGGATVVQRRPGRRVLTEELHRHELLDWLLDAGRRGESLELRPLDPSAATTVGRINEVLRTIRQARSEHTNPAIEADGQIYLLTAKQSLKFPVEKFALRPMQCLPDPRAPSLRLREGLPPNSTRPLMLHVEVNLVGTGPMSTISYRGPGPWLLRESIHLSQLGRWLSETQRLLSACDPPALMALVAEGAVEQAMTRSGIVRKPDALLSIEGELPFGLRVFSGGEVFGYNAPLALDALAPALLSHVPLGRSPQVSFSEIEITALGAPANPMLRLYARSRIYRYLQARFRRLG